MHPRGQAEPSDERILTDAFATLSSKSAVRDDPAASRALEVIAARLDPVAEPPADRIRHRDVGDQTGPEEALLAGVGQVDELIAQDERPRREVFPQRGLSK